MSQEKLIEVTDKAVQQLLSIREREQKPNHSLRVSVVGGGCSGLSYKLDFDDQSSESDSVMELGSLRIVVDPKSVLFLKGMILDFSDGLNGQGFVFNNPNAKSSCGCGSSFSA